MLVRSRTWLKTILLVLVLYCIRSICILIHFETFLNSLFITFDDFPPNYSEALIASKAFNTPLEYNYTTLPTSSNTIPNTIHFIWFQNLYETHPDRTSIPSTGSHAPRDCRTHNPSSEIIIWNSTSARALLATHYPWFLPTYDGYTHPIQRVDAFKYFVLYRHGGVYMDLDISCRRSLAPLLDFPAWFPRVDPLGVNNDLMAARAGHPVLRAMTERLRERDWGLVFPYLTIFWSTGPQFASDVLKEWWWRTRGRGWPGVGERKQGAGELAGRGIEGLADGAVDPDAFFVLPPMFYSEEYTFFGHSPGGTWHGKDVMVVLWLVDRPWVVFVALGAIVGSVVGVVKRRRNRKMLKMNEKGMPWA